MTNAAEIARESHRASFVDKGLAHKLQQYAVWSTQYDTQASGDKYRAPQVAISRLLSALSTDLKFQAQAQHSSTSSKPTLRVLDAGCGTGYGSEKLREYSDDESSSFRLHVIGVDFSPHMLAKATERGTYDELYERDLAKPLQLEGGLMDLIMCAGVFLEGHCNADALYTMLGELKRGGLASISFRITYFDSDEQGFLKAFEKAECEILSKDKLGYAQKDLFGYYFLVRKRD